VPLDSPPRVALARRIVREDFAMRFLLIAAVLTLTASAALAQGTPDSENGRFTFNQVQDGVLRLDTRTGHVSLCAKYPAGWACHAVPDERAALETEIVRLQTDNATLKKEMIARGVPLPGGMKTDPSGVRPQIELKLPSDAEIDRLMTFMEKIWRRLIDMVQGMQKDIEKKG
jgi:hypothetical protein